MIIKTAPDPWEVSAEALSVLEWDRFCCTYVK